MAALMTLDIDPSLSIGLLSVLELVVVGLAIAVVGVGSVLVVRGGTRTHPAVRWLTWIPVAVWVAAVLVDRWS